ncbi:hypothetical protein ACTAQJ_13605 [Arthrobacter sp. alpha11c]
MRAAGILPEDAPDPRAEWVENLKLMPIPVLGLKSQPSLDAARTMHAKKTPITEIAQVLCVGQMSVSRALAKATDSRLGSISR